MDDQLVGCGGTEEGGRVCMTPTHVFSSSWVSFTQRRGSFGEGSVSEGRKGEKVAMGLCLLPMVVGVLSLSTHLKLISLLEKQRPEERTHEGSR